MFKMTIFILMLFTSSAYAATGLVKGKIQYVRVHDSATHGSGWTPPIFWFTIEGVTSSGSCRKFGSNVLFVMDTDQAYSMVMAAFMADKEIAVRYDDSVLSPYSYCKATYLTVGNPPPLN